MSRLYCSFVSCGYTCTNYFRLVFKYAHHFRSSIIVTIKLRGAIKVQHIMLRFPSLGYDWLVMHNTVDSYCTMNMPILLPFLHRPDFFFRLCLGFSTIPPSTHETERGYAEVFKNMREFGSRDTEVTVDNEDILKQQIQPGPGFRFRTKEIQYGFIMSGRKRSKQPEQCPACGPWWPRSVTRQN